MLQWLKLLCLSVTKMLPNVTTLCDTLQHCQNNLRFYCVVHQRSYVTDQLPNVTVVPFAESIRFRFTVQAYDVPIVIVTIGSGLRFRFTVPVYDVPIVIVTIGTG